MKIEYVLRRLVVKIDEACIFALDRRRKLEFFALSTCRNRTVPPSPGKRHDCARYEECLYLRHTVFSMQIKRTKIMTTDESSGHKSLTPPPIETRVETDVGDRQK